MSERSSDAGSRSSTEDRLPAADSRLPPVVKSLGVVSFFNDLASEMVYPLIPAFVTSLGGGAVSLGLFDGISEALSSATKLGAGVAADHPRWRRPLVIAGYAIAALTRPVIGATTAAWQVITLRATDRVGKGIRNPARDAVIADATPPEMRGRAFGFHRAMDHAGGVVGPLLAWLLLSRAGLGPDDVIIWSVVPGLIAVVAVFWAMAGAGGGEPGAARAGSSAPPGSASPAPRARLTFFLIILFSFAKFPETLFLLRLQDVGVPIALAPLLWAALHIIRTTTSYPGGGLTDRFGPRQVMIGGWFAYWLVCLALAGASSPWAAAGWFLALGLVTALTESPERALVAATAPRRKTGTSFGVYHASVGAASLLGGIVFGLVYAGNGGPAALLASASVAGLAAGLLLLGGLDAGPEQAPR